VLRREGALCPIDTRRSGIREALRVDEEGDQKALARHRLLKSKGKWVALADPPAVSGLSVLKHVH